MAMKFSSPVPVAGIHVLNLTCWSPNPLTEVCTVKKRLAEGAKLLSKLRNYFKITFPCTSLWTATSKHFLGCSCGAVGQPGLWHRKNWHHLYRQNVHLHHSSVSFPIQRLSLWWKRWFGGWWWPGSVGQYPFAHSCVGNFMYFRNESRNSYIWSPHLTPSLACEMLIQMPQMLASCPKCWTWVGKWSHTEKKEREGVRKN